MNSQSKVNNENSPGIKEYFGLPVCHRTEYRNDKAVRMEVSVRAALLSEKKTRAKYGKILAKRELVPISEREILRGEGISDEVVVATIEKALYKHGMFKDLRLQMPDVFSAKSQLGLLAPYALHQLQSVQGFGSWQRREQEKAMKQMVKLWGTLEIEQVVPELCAKDLLVLSNHMANSILTLLRQMWTGVFANIVLDPMVWNRYHIPGRQNRYNAERLNTRMEQILVLPSERCAEIVKYAAEHVNEDRRFIALLIMLLLPITAYEVLALRLRDICVNPEFVSKYCMHVHNEVIPTNKSFEGKSRVRRHWNILHRIKTPYRNRYLPTGRLLRNLLDKIKNCGSDNDFLIPNPQNKKRHYAVAELMEWIMDTFPDLNKVVLLETSLFNHGRFGLREEELRYLRGMAPMHTDARYYTCFEDSSLQNAMSLTQDAWMNYIGCHTHEPVQRSVLELNGTAGRVVRAIVKITIPAELVTKDLLIDLCAAGGFNAHIIANATEKKC